MAIIFVIVAISTAISLLFLDKVIEYYLPKSGIAQLSDELDDVIIMIDDQGADAVSNKINSL